MWIILFILCNGATSVGDSLQQRLSLKGNIVTICQDCFKTSPIITLAKRSDADAHCEGNISNKELQKNMQ